MSKQRTFLDLQPILPMGEWWEVFVCILVTLAFIVFIVFLYRREAAGISRGLAILLASLRLLALATILLFVLNPSMRSESRLTKNSRLAVLVDTSLSMGLKDHTTGAEAPRRIDDVIEAFRSTRLINRLREHHDLTIYRFGDEPQPQPMITLPRILKETSDATDAKPFGRVTDRLFVSRRIGYLALLMFGLSMLLLASWLFTWVSNRQQWAGWLAASGTWMLLAGVIALGISDLNTPEFELTQSLGWVGVDLSRVSESSSSSQIEEAGSSEARASDVDWEDALAPRGTSTQLGSVVQHVVNKERGGPIAGIVVITDGGSNAGSEPARAIAAAANASIPIFPVGIGSVEAPKNVQVADVQAPTRVFPGDKFKVKALIQAFGLEGQTIRVDLLSVDEKEIEAELLEAETTVQLAADGQSVPVEFDVVRQEQGRRRYVVRTAPVDGDLESRDDRRGVTVEIVDRKTQVLLIAGGPTREFRFLRNQLYRDKDVILHVWLQTAKEGADQEADEMLFEFPQTREQLFNFDCIIAFDPDWRELNANQAALLERWVAEQAGGMLLVAGPVNTPEWTRRPRGDETIDKIRQLYPVSFYSQGSAVLKLGRFGGERAYPLEFTREGRAAEYLWLGDSSSESLATWSRFEGVFGYYAVNEPKAGADVLALFADPDTLIDDRLPIYLASQFYGAGRVFFQASGEMWRVRRMDVEYFQNYYLKLIRWVSQGRLLRDSTRGVLLTDRERCWMGDQVVVQAMLRDLRDDPLMLPSVEALIALPDGSSTKLVLQGTKDSVRPGTYTGQFSANLEGEYRINLPIPGSVEQEVLTALVQANIPDLEKVHPQRNDALLSEMAEKTQGHYFVGMSECDVTDDKPLSLVRLIQPQDQETVLPGTPDRNFQRRLMWWLLGLIVLCLSLEWTFRRLHKLA